MICYTKKIPAFWPVIPLSNSLIKSDLYDNLIYMINKEGSIIKMTAYLVSKDRGNSWIIRTVQSIGGTEKVKPSDFEGKKLIVLEEY